MQSGMQRFTATAFAVFLLLPALVSAQVNANRQEGLRDNTPRWHAITDVRLVLAPGKVIEQGTLVMRDGRIVAVGAGIAAPAGARVWRLPGRTVYAGFIDLASSVGVPAGLRAAQATGPGEGGLGAREAAVRAAAPSLSQRALGAQNKLLRPDIDLANLLEINTSEVKAARDLGFTTVLAVPATGIVRGQSALINLGDGSDAKSLVLASRVAQHLAHAPERGPGSGYPNSLMGAIALVRQTLYDARWWARAKDVAFSTERLEANSALEALKPAVSGQQRVIYLADDEQQYQRIVKLRDEFGLRVILQGNGHEYRRAAQLKTSGMPLIVPLNFPLPPEVENPDTVIDIGLDQLQHWEQAPSNLAALHTAGVAFAITAHGLREPAREFWPQLRQAVKRGLPVEHALAALTTTPAKLLGMEQQIGSLTAGSLANIVIANGDLFSGEGEIEVSFVDGHAFTTAVYDRADVRGTWRIAADSAEWKIAGTVARPTLSIDGKQCDVTLRGRNLRVSLPCTRRPMPTRLNGDGEAPAADIPAVPDRQVIVAELVGRRLQGGIQAGNGAGPITPWMAERSAVYVEPKPANLRAEVMPPALTPHYPAGAFGILPPAKPAVLLIRNATVWTSAAAGRLTQSDVLIQGGKIAAIGRALVAPTDAIIIDATGKHVTPGIIDAHSHTAILGNVNESTSSITAEVRIGDVLDATDINIYRQLAGGVTAANVLHGSANTIGGQSQTIKFRWGSDADDLKFGGAMPGIKFALGENVKQSNWDAADRGATARYPQTRMGVEQILRDGFAAARDYQASWARHRAASKTVAEPRRDLQLDALLEILDKKRVVHIHSYRADEILMFARLAKQFDFTVATFQHVLEGYKVADAIASIGAGGSTFSDWWAYKMEVYDAIPTNGALMHKAGVVTSFNSDSNELARRLNTEAAKAVRYGGIAETEALKFVTLNAAKQLRIDHRVGSLEVGKDADLVIWNGDPLSSTSLAEQTWIDGRRYFDLDTDKALRADAARERDHLIVKALPARLARLASATARNAVSGTQATPPPQNSEDVRNVIAYLAIQQWVHQMKQSRTSYWDGGNWHECTEDAR